jgi:hypothetical protein
VHAAWVSLHANTGVQPHPFYSLAGAVVGTALLCTLLLWAFTHSLPLKVRSRFLQLHLVTQAVAPSKRVVQEEARRAIPLRRATASRRFVPKPVVIPKTAPIKPLQPRAPLDLSLPGLTFAPPAASSFVPHAFNPNSNLSRALNAPPSPPSGHNDDSYRSVYGFPVVKSGGRCLALETIQVGPSPSAHSTVGFGVPCPGGYRPSMADELKAWAGKQARKQHAPQ